MADESRQPSEARNRRWAALQALYDEPLSDTELAEAESNLLTFLTVLLEIDRKRCAKATDSEGPRADPSNLRADTDGRITAP